MEKKDLLLWADEKKQIAAVLETNEYISRFGLSLSEQEAAFLVKSRYETLKEQHRVEFGESILPKIIFAFCDSCYVDCQSFAETTERLQEIFYLYKNEALDELTDDELLDFMREKFDSECEGSLEYLEETVLDEFARNVRKYTRKYIGRYKAGENEGGI